VALEKGVHEEAALVVVLPEPFVERVEDREELLRGGAAPGLDAVEEPALEPDLLTAPQNGDHEVDLGWEVGRRSSSRPLRRR
jgi:hypothetical protein